VALSRSTKNAVGDYFTLRIQFVFGHGGDHPSYVDLILKPFHLSSTGCQQKSKISLQKKLALMPNSSQS